MKCWRCLEKVSEEDPSCPHCGLSFSPENDMPRWKLERNVLDSFALRNVFAFLFLPSVVTIFIDAFTGFSLKTFGNQSPLLLIIAFSFFSCANHSVKNGILVGKFFNVEREKSQTTFNIFINIQVLISLVLTLFAVGELIK